MTGRGLSLTLGLAAALLFLLSLGVGPVGLSPGDLLAGLAGAGDPATVLIARELRLPRAVLGFLIGASLGLSGAVLQGLLRNPLAEPGLLGISGAAAFGAVCALYFGLGALWPLAPPLFGFAGAIIAVLLLLGLAGGRRGDGTMILAGVAIASLAGAGVALALNLAPSGYAALEIAFWLLGSLADRSLVHLALAGPCMVIGMALLFACARGVDALGLGQDAALSLGVRVGRLRALAAVGAALCVGAGVAVAGAIGFVGLVVPHLIRGVVGQEPSRLLLPSALGGAALLLAADIAVRFAPTAQELKLGVVTALIGAPFFLSLLLRLRREG